MDVKGQQHCVTGVFRSKSDVAKEAKENGLVPQSASLSPRAAPPVDHSAVSAPALRSLFEEQRRWAARVMGAVWPSCGAAGGRGRHGQPQLPATRRQPAACPALPPQAPKPLFRKCGLLADRGICQGAPGEGGAASFFFVAGIFAAGRLLPLLCCASSARRAASRRLARSGAACLD